MPDHHPYRIATRRGDLHLIWRAGAGDEPDTVAVDGRGRLLAFHDTGTLAGHCDRHGWALVADEPATLDLEGVREWAEDPRRGTARQGPLLDAWNFFEDLARSVAVPLPPQGAVHDAAYEKFFDADDGAQPWTAQEAAAVRDLLNAGLALWEESVRGAAGPASAPTTAPPLAPDAVRVPGHENGQCRKNT
ncbi:hypothetical protein [Streptomyces sp. c-19]|uniref:hypothetical protein n=1 Tax=Streptomyces sp. c-19 TaxID=2789275 RepID=UPI003980297F